MRLPLLLLIAAVSADAWAAAPLQLDCPDPVAGCRSADGVAVRFSQIPKPMQPFGLEVIVKSRMPVRASFEMRGMDMGDNRYRLLPKGGKWQARVTLPSCMSGHREWVMRLEVGDRVYELPFDSR